MLWQQGHSTAEDAQSLNLPPNCKLPITPTFCMQSDCSGCVPPWIDVEWWSIPSCRDRSLAALCKPRGNEQEPRPPKEGGLAFRAGICT